MALDDSGPWQPNPSITNIIGMMDEGFLPGFYAKLVATHAVENFESIRFMAEKFGPQTAIGALKAIPTRPHPAAAIGDEVHDAIDKMACGTIAADAEFSTLTARQMFRQWRYFYETERPEILASEYTVWSYTHGYAGSGDLLWKWRDAVWIIDTKTGNRVYPKVAMQCAALARADVIVSDDGHESPMPKTDKLGVMHVRPRSVKVYELQHAEQAFSAFLGLKAAFDWRRAWKESSIPEQPVAATEQRAS